MVAELSWGVEKMDQHDDSADPITRGYDELLAEIRSRRVGTSLTSDVEMRPRSQITSQRDQSTDAPQARAGTPHAMRGLDVLLHDDAPIAGRRAPANTLEDTVRSIVDHLGESDRRTAQTLRDIQSQLSTLSTRTEALSQAPASEQVSGAIARLEARIDTLAQKIEHQDEQATSPDVEALQGRIVSLARTIEQFTGISAYEDDPAGESEPAPALSPEEPASLSDADDNSDEAFERAFLRRRGLLNDQPDAAQANSPEPQKEPAARTGEARLPVPRMAFSADQVLERHVADINERLAHRFDELSQTLHKQIQAAAPSSDLTELQALVQSLSQKIDDMAERRGDALPGSVGAQVGEIGRRLDQTDERFSQLDGLEKTLEQLFQRLDSAEQSLLQVAQGRFETSQSLDQKLAEIFQHIDTTKDSLIDAARSAAIDAANEAVHSAAETAAREAVINNQDAALNAAREAARSLLRDQSAPHEIQQSASSNAELVDRLQNNLGSISRSVADDSDAVSDAAGQPPIDEDLPPPVDEEASAAQSAAGDEDDQHSFIMAQGDDDPIDLPDPLANLRLPPLEQDAEPAAEQDMPAADLPEQDHLAQPAGADIDADAPREPGSGPPRGARDTAPLKDAGKQAESLPRQTASFAQPPQTDAATPSLRNARTTAELLAAARKAAQAAAMQQTIAEARNTKKSWRDRLKMSRGAGQKKPLRAAKKPLEKIEPQALPSSARDPRQAEASKPSKPRAAKPIPATPAVNPIPTAAARAATIASRATNMTAQARPITAGARPAPVSAPPRNAARIAALLALATILLAAGSYQAYRVLKQNGISLITAPDAPAAPIAAPPPDKQGLLAPLTNLASTRAVPATDMATATAGLLTPQATLPQTPALASTVPSPAQIQGSDEDTVAALPAPSNSATAETLPAELGPDGLRQAALAGDPIAQFEIASRYSEGRGIAADMATAAMWYQRAAAQGLAPAQYRLGSLYEKGEGVPIDLASAKIWYGRAASGGNRKAMHNLAVLYSDSKSGEPDFEKAAEWFKQAAELGLTDSQYNLGILYARGLGVPQNLSDAYKWFAILANNGDSDAAQRRDAIAEKLDAHSLAAAKLAAQTWRAKPLSPEANAVKLPSENWHNTTSNAAPALSVGGTSAQPGRDIVRISQQLLNRLGYKVGDADGLWGPRTRAAVEAFERASGLPASGQLSPDLLFKMQDQLSGNNA